MELHELLIRARLDGDSFEAFVAEGWIARRDAPDGYDELEVARTRLIRELREELGVNDEGVGVALGLLDQVHGLRIVLRQVTACLRALPEPLRTESLVRLRGSPEDCGNPLA